MLSLTVETERKEEDLDIVRAGMKAHSEKFTPPGSYEDLTIVLRDEKAAFTGVALGEAGRGWLHISLIWVHEDFRGKGYGQKLLEAIENESLKKGCKNAYLDTFSYQAKPFYEKNGYKVFGCLEDYPEGHKRYYMNKGLG